MPISIKSWALNERHTRLLTVSVKFMLNATDMPISTSWARPKPCSHWRTGHSEKHLTYCYWSSVKLKSQRSKRSIEFHIYLNSSRLFLNDCKRSFSWLNVSQDWVELNRNYQHHGHFAQQLAQPYAHRPRIPEATKHTKAAMVHDQVQRSHGT